MKHILVATVLILSVCSSGAEMMLLEVKEKRELTDEKLWPNLDNSIKS